MNRINSLAITLLLVPPAAHNFAAATPVVFWAPDPIAPRYFRQRFIYHGVKMVGGAQS